MSLSVVIPAYKARNFITEALRSVAAQTLAPLEILIIDDASPEPIDDLLAGFDVRLIRHEVNHGLGAARNTGIHAATGEWIAFLDHDDLWRPEHLENLSTTAEQQQADVIFSTAILFTTDPNTSTGEWGPTPEEMTGNLSIRLMRRSFITPSATLIRKSLLAHIGGFDTDPTVHMCEDLDLWLRLHEAGARFAHAAKVTALYRKHPDAATSRPVMISEHTANVIDRNLHRVRAPWWIKRSIAAQARWMHLHMSFIDRSATLWILFKAITHSLPVPWEIGRGLLRLSRIKR